MASGGGSCVLVEVRRRACASPIAHAPARLRPLPLEVRRELPRFVIGTSVERGTPTLDVDLSPVLGATKERTSWSVVVRAGARAVALAVETIVSKILLDSYERQPCSASR